MDKYTLLVLLNTPFVLYGILKALESYKRHIVSQAGLVIRVGFWLTVLAALVFAQLAYDFLANHNLTNSPPLSLADVVLVTGLNFSLFLCMRLYSKVESLERRVSDLHEKLSIKLSRK